MFKHALEHQTEYLRIVTEPETLKMPQLQGMLEKKLTNRQQHMNSMILEANIESWKVRPRTKKMKAKKTVFGQVPDEEEDEQHQQSQSCAPFTIHS